MQTAIELAPEGTGYRAKTRMARFYNLPDRAEDVRNRAVRPEEDNLLRITNDGMKLALDQRLINDLLPDYENSEASVCAKKGFRDLGADNGAEANTDNFL